MSLGVPRSADSKWVRTRRAHRSRAPRNVNLKARWNVGKSRARLIAGAARHWSPRSTPALGPKRVCLRRLGFLFAEAQSQPGRLILFRPQHLSGFQVDNVQLRARQARD